MLLSLVASHLVHGLLQDVRLVSRLVTTPYCAYWDRQVETVAVSIGALGANITGKLFEINNFHNVKYFGQF